MHGIIIKNKGEIEMTKREFKKKCISEKRNCTKLIRTGTILAVCALIIIAVNYFLSQNIVYSYILQIVIFIIGGLLAFIGMIFDLIGEVTLSNEYKEFNK